MTNNVWLASRRKRAASVSPTAGESETRTRQDAGGTLQCAVGVPPTRGESGTRTRQDAGGTLAHSTKPTNPKDLVGSNKLPLHLWPETATALGCLGFLDGALKYGRANFRAVGVRASIYFDAVKRHVNAWFEGEEKDPDSGLSHLSHALACIAIIVDAAAAGKLNDDRQIAGGYRKFLDKLTPEVARLKKLHAHRHPKHYTIADNVPSASRRQGAKPKPEPGRMPGARYSVPWASRRQGVSQKPKPGRMPGAR